MQPKATTSPPRRPRMVTVDLQATGVASMHADGARVVLHSLPTLVLQLPKDRTHVATWCWRGEAVLTCSGEPYAARVEFKGPTEVEGRVLDADSLRSVAVVQGSLVAGVTMTHDGLVSVLLPPPRCVCVPTINLDDLGPRRMSLLWSVLHDALLFAQPVSLSLRPLHVQGEQGEQVQGGQREERGSAALPPCIAVGYTHMNTCSSQTLAELNRSQAARARGEVPRYAFYLRLHQGTS